MASTEDFNQAVRQADKTLDLMTIEAYVAWRMLHVVTFLGFLGDVFGQNDVAFCPMVSRVFADAFWCVYL